MEVVALVSGGKDSCYSLHLCQKHGHKVVALANLLPEDSNVDELDSYMYQTVGHQLVSAYAACTGLPLYRRRILGSSRSQGLSYSTTAGDEVEDLFLLLAYIKEVHPGVQAVASGAIASDYQRLRVESVCSRLGLVSLGYLWHQPQEQLLAGMINNDIEAVLVKVAALGLDPHKHLGKSIRQLQPHLHSLRDRFGCNVCGEGGEYETLTLDCPAFTHGRIVLDDWEVVLHSPDSIAAVGVLHPTAFHVEPKQQLGGSAAAHTPTSTPQQADSTVIEVPVDWRPQQLPSTATQPDTTTQQWEIRLQMNDSGGHLHVMCSAHTALPAGGAAAAGTSAPFTAADTAAALDAALLAVTQQLHQLQGRTSWQLSCFVHLYLSHMSHFAAANAAYCRHLPQVNPPSRACVQVPLPPGCPVLLDVMFAQHTTVNGSSNCVGSGSDCNAATGEQQQQQQQQQQVDRRVLHVQSISDWAPSCIGPYSQATSCNGIIHMAGQIPLDPGSMNIVAEPHTPPPTSTAGNETQHINNSSSSGASGASGPDDGSCAGVVAAQVWRTLCSCQAVAVAVKSCFASSCLGLTVYLTPQAAAAGGQAMMQAALEEAWRDRDCLNWPDRMPAALIAAAAAAAAGGGGGCGTAAAAGVLAVESGSAAGGGLAVGQGSGGATGPSGSESEGEESEGGGQQAVLDDYLMPPAVQEVLQPTVVYLTVPALPRGALLEVQPLLVDLSAAAAQGCSSSSSSSDDDDAGGSAADASAGVAAVEGTSGHTAAEDALQQHGVALHVTQPDNSTWRRALLQLKDGDNQGQEVTTETRAAQAGALAQWLSAAASLTTGQEPQMASVRCWYDSKLQEEVQGELGWAKALLSWLPTKVAGQLVPVSGIASSMGHLNSWCIVEVIYRL